MSEQKKPPLDSEAILLTLDQIGQTIDIMTNVVGRLRGYIVDQIDSETKSPKTIDCHVFPEQTSQTLH